MDLIIKRMESAKKNKKTKKEWVKTKVRMIKGVVE
jgi:hypothetical protein